jgi:hypothetical protein
VPGPQSPAGQQLPGAMPRHRQRALPRPLDACCRTQPPFPPRLFVRSERYSTVPQHLMILAVVLFVGL